MKTCSMALILLLAACATPFVTLHNDKTGRTETCGGGTGGSLAGGMIGYSIQRNGDNDCITALKAQGYHVVDVH